MRSRYENGRFRADCTGIVWSMLALVACRSEAFATSFYPRMAPRGGEVSRSVLKHPTNGDWSSFTTSEASHFLDYPLEELLPADFVAETNLPTEIGMFKLRAYRVPQGSNPFIGTEPCVIYNADKPPFLGINGELAQDVPIRVHDQCLTSEVLGSQRCDCSDQLKMGLEYINEHGGAVIYMPQEGRGIGLANKVAAYALQDEGMDTVDANLHLGLPEDCREYGAVPAILADLKVGSIRLMTNNPRKVDRLTALGVQVSGTIPMVVERANPYNVRYLETKKARMHHKNFGNMLSRGLDYSNVAMQPRRNGFVMPNGQSNGHASGDANGHANGKSNGYANGHANGKSNGYANGHANGKTNGYPNGHANGKTNGYPNGHANGKTNGESNGVASGVAQKFRREGEALATHAVHVSLAQEDQVAEMQGVTAQEDGYCFGRESVEEAIEAISRGELVVVVDDMDRENEGDFIMAADACTPEHMAQIVRYSSGVVCVTMEGRRLDELGLPPMVVNNEDPKGTAFTVTVDASKEHGITTGISARDRSITAQLLADEDTKSVDIVRPGHMFPLRAREGGVLTRDGHTEAAVDLARLAGRSPCGVICEIVSEENPTEMARLPELMRFAKKHGYVITSIADLIQYRRDTEN